MSKRKPMDKGEARERRQHLLQAAATAELSLTDGVRGMRALANMTQEEFAQHRGVSARVIKAIELGQGNPTVGTLNRIGEFFGLEVAFVPKRPVQTPGEPVLAESTSELSPVSKSTEPVSASSHFEAHRTVPARRLWQEFEAKVQLQYGGTNRFVRQNNLVESLTQQLYKADLLSEQLKHVEILVQRLDKAEKLFVQIEQAESLTENLKKVESRLSNDLKKAETLSVQLHEMKDLNSKLESVERLSKQLEQIHSLVPELDKLEEK